MSSYNFNNNGFGEERRQSNEQSDREFDTDKLFGLPQTEDYNFGDFTSGVFNLADPLDGPSDGGRPVTNDSYDQFLEEGDAYLQTNTPVSDPYTSNGSTQQVNHPPRMSGTSVAYNYSAPRVAIPRYRTDSGSEVPAVLGPTGQWLHPRNGRVLDAQELRWSGQGMMTAAPSIYHAPQTQSHFNPMLSSMPTPTDFNFYNYPDPMTDPTFFNSAPQYGPIDPSFNMSTSVEEPAEEAPRTSERRRSSERSTGSTSKAARINRRQPLYNVEQPKMDRDKPWVRVNSATKGNTRTGKTNNYGDGPYRNTLHPLGVQNPEWTATNGTTFKLNQWGEFNSVSFSAEELMFYLYEHPFHNQATRARLPQAYRDAIAKNNPKLILWIQKMPGDSAKRVKTQHGLKCRVRECPAAIYKTRTINTGHYRVALDEQWSVYGDRRNPMHVAGYAHLYCMERFFDWTRICTDFDVRVDDREIPSEPTGEWVPGLGHGSEEYKVARDFIMACKTGRGVENWANYPRWNSARPLARKNPHSATLTCRLVERKAASTGNSKMKMMKARGESKTQFFVNMGDLQMQVDEQQKKNASRARASKGRATLKRKVIDDSDEDADDAIEVEDDSDNGGPNMDEPDADYDPRPRKRARRTNTSRSTAPGRSANRGQAESRRSTSSDTAIANRLRSAGYGPPPQAPTAQMYPVQEESIFVSDDDE